MLRWTLLLQGVCFHCEKGEEDKEDCKEKKDYEEKGDCDENIEDLSSSFFFEVSERSHGNFSDKSRVNGLFAKKNPAELSWRNFIRNYFKEHPGCEVICCKKSYFIPNSFITHVYRNHNPKNLSTLLSA